jgi:hypothetical protein
VYAARDTATGGRVALKVVACGGPQQVPISVVRREVRRAARRAPRAGRGGGQTAADRRPRLEPRAPSLILSPLTSRPAPRPFVSPARPSQVTLSSQVAHEHLVQLLDVFAQGEDKLVIVVGAFCPPFRVPMALLGPRGLAFNSSAPPTMPPGAPLSSQQGAPLPPNPLPQCRRPLLRPPQPPPPLASGSWWRASTFWSC